MHQTTILISSLVLLVATLSHLSFALPSSLGIGIFGIIQPKRQWQQWQQWQHNHNHNHNHNIPLHLALSTRGGDIGGTSGGGGDNSKPKRKKRKTKRKSVGKSNNNGPSSSSATRTATATATSSKSGDDAVVVKSKKKRTKSRRKKDNDNDNDSNGDETATADAADSADVDVDGEMIVHGAKKLRKAIKDDPSTMMGDAIRARSSELLQDSLEHPRKSMGTRSVNGHGNGHGHVPRNNGHAQRDATPNIFTSLSYAIGTSDDNSIKEEEEQLLQQQQKDMDEGGGVEPNPSAVIANYFLKSHGGMHGLQSITSLLAVLFGLGSFACPQNKPILRLRLLQRCLVSALAKHLSGFLGVASLSAGSIPDIGWRETRRRVEDLILDPVAQYLFYCALLIVWSNNAIVTVGGTVAAAAATADKVKEAATAISPSSVVVPWWLSDSRLCLICILGPILLREIVSSIWVASDVIVLHHSARSSETTPAILKIGMGAVDAIMSLLLTPTEWRNANPALKQKMLAKLVGKTSLGLEVATCMILIIDALRAFMDYSISPVESRPSMLTVAKRVICARLMINFMLVRRKKVKDLVGTIRGGARHVPGRVLDCLLEPGKAMGLGYGGYVGNGGGDEEEEKNNPKTLSEWLVFLLGF